MVLDDQDGILTDRHVRGAPAIVIEILSAGTRRRDQTLKRHACAQSGVREYWLVDPERRVVRVCSRTAGELVDAETLSVASGDVLRSALLPGFSLFFETMFAERRAG